MSKELKKFIVQELVSRYRNNRNFVFVTYQGIDALKVNKLREGLRSNGITLNVVKNSLFLIAFNEIGVQAEIKQFINGLCGVATNTGDCIEFAKVLIEYSKKEPNLKINGGYLDGRLVDIKKINELSNIPGRSVLNVQLLAGIKTPIIGILNIFNSLSKSLLICLKEIRDKKGQEE